MSVQQDRYVATRSEEIVLFLLLSLLLVAPLMITAMVSVETAKWSIIRVGGTVLCAAWILLGVWRGRSPLRLDAFSLLAFALVGTQLFSLTVATNVPEGITEISKQIGLLSIFLLVANVPKNANDRNRICSRSIHGPGIAFS